jgi:hypothetical protein
MSRYCLDANVLIEAKNGPYAFDLVPRFWKWIEEMLVQDTVYSSIMVYKELAEGSDELSVWVKTLKRFFLEPSEMVQNTLSAIANFVTERYEPQQAQIFLDGADAWVIAQSKIDSATVVTHETLVDISSKKAKIPNVCEVFGVPYINTYGMMRALGASFA